MIGDLPADGGQIAGAAKPPVLANAFIKATLRKPKRRHRRRGDVPRGPAIWLITFTDVMGLMLTFFVMMFSMSAPKVESWKSLTTSLDQSLVHNTSAAKERGSVDSISIDKISFERALDIRYLEALLKSTISENQKLNAVQLIPQPGQLVISMPQDMLFTSGSAEIRTEGGRLLYVLGESLSRIKNRIEIIGHADPHGISSGSSYSSNWGLSLARASNVAGTLSKMGYSKSIDIKGYSSGRFEDLAGIVDQGRRYDLSRRVDIVVMDHAGRQDEPLFDIGLP